MYLNSKIARHLVSLSAGGWMPIVAVGLARVWAVAAHGPAGRARCPTRLWFTAGS